MRFKVKTYFGDTPKPGKSQRLLSYIFNVLYRTVIPIIIFYSLLTWNVGTIIKALLFGILLFFALYQFTWEVE